MIDQFCLTHPIPHLLPFAAISAQAQPTQISSVSRRARRRDALVSSLQYMLGESVTCYMPRRRSSCSPHSIYHILPICHGPRLRPFRGHTTCLLQIPLISLSNCDPVLLPPAFCIRSVGCSSEAAIMQYRGFWLQTGRPARVFSCGEAKRALRAGPGRKDRRRMVRRCGRSRDEGVGVMLGKD